GQVISIKSADELATKLNAASKTSRLAIVYFTAPWSGPCRFYGPKYTRLAEENQNVVFLKVDLEEAMQVAAKWNINILPTFYLWKDGETVDKVVDGDFSSLEKKIGELSASLSTAIVVA
ncbi:tpr repeat-containing thioredoxin tdx, partial [Phtheirospermum japonicum]